MRFVRQLAVVVAGGLGIAMLMVYFTVAQLAFAADAQPRTKGVWAQWFLTQLEAPTSERNLAFVVAWIDKENTTSQWNPLATTKNHDRVVGQHNSHGVRWYADAQAGIEASVSTLVHGYPSITRALRSDNQDAALAAPGWGAYSGGSAAYANGIGENFRHTMQNYDAKLAEPLRSAGPTDASVNDVGVAPHGVAENTEKAVSPVPSQVGGLRLRYALIAPVGMTVVAGLVRAKRLQVGMLFGAVGVLLACDAMSSRFSFHEVWNEYTAIGREMVAILGAWAIPVTVGAVLASFGFVALSLKTDNKAALMSVLRTIPKIITQSGVWLWRWKQPIGYTAALIGLANYGSQLGAGLVAALITACFVGIVAYRTVPGGRARLLALNSGS